MRSSLNAFFATTFLLYHIWIVVETIKTDIINWNCRDSSFCWGSYSQHSSARLSTSLSFCEADFPDNVRPDTIAGGNCNKDIFEVSSRCTKWRRYNSHPLTTATDKHQYTMYLNYFRDLRLIRYSSINISARSTPLICLLYRQSYCFQSHYYFH